MSLFMDMYSKSGAINRAENVFPTSMILGYRQQGFREKAISLFYSMRDMKPDAVTLVVIVGLQLV